MDFASASGKVWELSQDRARCHDVQRLLDESNEQVRVAIAEELRGHVWEAMQHPHANYVVQKCIESLRPSASQFIIDEIISNDIVQKASQHKFGCQILQRLLEFCRTDQVNELVEILLNEALCLTKR